MGPCCLFGSEGRAKVLHMPYRGGGAPEQAVFGGEVYVLVDTLTVATPHIQSGRFRALAVTIAAPWLSVLSLSGVFRLRILTLITVKRQAWRVRFMSFPLEGSVEWRRSCRSGDENAGEWVPALAEPTRLGGDAVTLSQETTT